MAKTETATLSLDSRTDTGSRAMRRLRRSGAVPGVLYGGEADAVPFQVDALTLRNTLAKAGAVLEVTVGSGETENVVVKDIQRHPVRGDIIHADLLRVRMDVAIQTPVSVELLGADVAPGVTEGGVLSQEHREIIVEALPGDIPDVIQAEVSHLNINETLTLASLTPPPGVTFVDDPDTVLATITPPTLEPVEEEIETETELIGEDGEPIEAPEGEEGEAPAAEGEQSAESSDDSE